MSNIYADATHAPSHPFTKSVCRPWPAGMYKPWAREPEAFDFEYETGKAARAGTFASTEAQDEMCHCPAYPDPHEPGVGDCRASGNVVCPACAVILDDDDVECKQVVPPTRYQPPEYITRVHRPCGNCGFVGDY